MQTADGGWTLVERSPRQQPIGRALFADVAVNPETPESSRFRIKQAAIELLVAQTTEMRIDCGGDDYLLTDSAAIFTGKDGPPQCFSEAVTYKEARLKGFALMNTALCTGILGEQDGGPGAWHIDEASQEECSLPPFPWDFMVPVTSPGADAFAVDAAVLDDLQDPPPIHDCHQGTAVRVVMLR
ncbi:hypothetical protein [Nannocystis exedens]|nr:hypothetical protein [Nannocystis exedens]